MGYLSVKIAIAITLAKERVALEKRFLSVPIYQSAQRGERKLYRTTRMMKS